MMAKRRILSWLVAASLALSLVPTAVLAAEGEEIGAAEPTAAEQTEALQAEYDKIEAAA